MAYHIYIAGPYSAGSESANVRAALAAADKLWDAGLVPFVPHLSHFWDMISPGRSYQQWMDWCLAWVDTCDGVLRLPGESPGADAECAFAGTKGIPVFHSVDEVVAWAKALNTFVGVS